MLEPKEVEKLEKRASAAVAGCAYDENISPYVYGRDVTALLNERRDLVAKVTGLERQVEKHR